MRQKVKSTKQNKEKYEYISDKEFLEAVEEIEKRYGKALAELAKNPN